ncbi:MAG: acylneuraminate cytidylyltransferase family protein [Chromatiaceae bacterium]|nr:acylneuraminate cytidylyltransferase family protein [Chromatiaceae bacterium]
MSFERICVVPARGGSKGFPGKNLKVFSGETLVASAVRKAIKSKAFDRVVLTSDDVAILSEGYAAGAICHQRSAAASSDCATSEDALLEVLRSMRVGEGTVAMVQCTTPLISAEDIAACVALAESEPVCSVVSGYAASLHHWLLRPDGTLVPVGGSENLRQPRQRVGDRIFVENGGIYVTDVASFLKSGNRFNGVVIPYLMEEMYSVDIDSEMDFDCLLKLSPLIMASGSRTSGK